MTRGIVLLALAFPLAGQVSREALENWRMAKEFTLAVADAMPVEHYGFKLHDEQMSFGRLMAHIASAQAFRLAQIAGVPMPLRFPEKVEPDRAKAVARDLLSQSFDFCLAQLPKLTAAQLRKLHRVDWYGRPEVSGEQLVLGMLVHTAHHRGQAEVYLRAKGIQPPAYRF